MRQRQNSTATHILPSIYMLKRTFRGLSFMIGQFFSLEFLVGGIFFVLPG